MRKQLIPFIILLTLSLNAEEQKAYNFWQDEMTNYVIMLPENWIPDFDHASQTTMDSYFLIDGFQVQNIPAEISTYWSFNVGSLDDFISQDMTTFIENYPIYEYETIDFDVMSKNNQDITFIHVFSSETTYDQYICYMDGGQEYMLAIALTLFEEDEEENRRLIDDFLQCSEESMIYPYLYKFNP